MGQNLIKTIPPIRGRVTENAPLGAMGWFKTGGCAEILFKPADLEDLTAFLKGLSPDIPVHIFGVISNCIIREGGVRGVVIRLGRDFAKLKVEKALSRVSAGALALDNNVAMIAADAAIAGLEFYSGIPGTIGGALRMNAGCYGMETKDVLIEATALDRQGNLHVLTPEDMGMGYRHNAVPEDHIFTHAVFQGRAGKAAEIKAHMQDIKERRAQSQPLRERTGGSTFANPSAAELVKMGFADDTKVWQLIDTAGCRGLMVGGAQMSEKHCNFMINTGTASASNLENLGEEVRRRVYETHGIRLRWEIKRLGERL